MLKLHVKIAIRMTYIKARLQIAIHVTHKTMNITAGLARIVRLAIIHRIGMTQPLIITAVTSRSPANIRILHAKVVMLRGSSQAFHRHAPLAMRTPLIMPGCLVPIVQNVMARVIGLRCIVVHTRALQMRAAVV